MTKQPPKWDVYIRELTVAKLQQHLPLMGNFERLTIYSEDRSWILLASIDVDVLTSNVSELKVLLPTIITAYRHATIEKLIDHKKAYRARVDFVEICNLLADQADNGEDYLDPDQLFSLMLTDEKNRMA